MSAYAKVHLSDVDDAAPKFGIETQSFRSLREPLALERSGMSFQELKPGARQTFGHAHDEEEEVYVVVSGAGRMRVADEEVQLRALDAVRVDPTAVRAFEAGPEGLAFLAYGAPGAGQGDGRMIPDRWGDGA